MRLHLAPAVAAFVLAINAHLAQADQVSSPVLAKTCFSCHGPNGQSKGAMPSINGKPAKYIETVLNAYRQDKKQGTVMNRIAKGFTPEEIKMLSRYFSNLK
jgi:cytochrome subunit of sulfide dehydrogenase